MATVLPDDPRLERCGFCKLHGPDFEFISKRYDIQIGRRSKSAKLDVVLGALSVPVDCERGVALSSGKS
jgi:hypothetical protein